MPKGLFPTVVQTDLIDFEVVKEDMLWLLILLEYNFFCFFQ